MPSPFGAVGGGIDAGIHPATLFGAAVVGGCIQVAAGAGSASALAARLQDPDRFDATCDAIPARNARMPVRTARSLRARRGARVERCHRLPRRLQYRYSAKFAYALCTSRSCRGVLMCVVFGGTRGRSSASPTTEPIRCRSAVVATAVRVSRARPLASRPLDVPPAKHAECERVHEPMTRRADVSALAAWAAPWTPRIGDRRSSASAVQPVASSALRSSTRCRERSKRRSRLWAPFHGRRGIRSIGIAIAVGDPDGARSEADALARARPPGRSC